MRIVAALALIVVLTGCSGDRDPASAPGTATAETAVAAPSATISGRCPVTLPDSVVRTSSGEFNYGDRSLATSIWPKGRLVAGRLPDGSTWAEIADDGSIEAKAGWWRGVEGELTIEGERLDAAAPPLRAFIPDGYGPTGFQATGLTFPTIGCWRVAGRIGSVELAFVVLVRKR